MKTFKEFLEESWRSLAAPSQARELSKEFDPNYHINKKVVYYFKCKYK